MTRPALSSETPGLLFLTQGWRGRGLGFLFGGLAVLGQAPFHFWPVTLLCLALLFARLKWATDTEKPMRSAFSAGFWFGFGYFLVGTYWIGSAFIARGPEFIPAMPPMILGLGALLASFWGLAGLIYAKINPQNIWAGTAFVSLFFLAEMTRGHLFGGFPWNLPGYIFEAGGALSQSASIFGVYGLSFLVFIVSALISSVLFSKQRLRPAIGTIAIIAILFGYGTLRLHKAVPEMHENIRLRIVQVQFDQKDKFDPDPQKSFDIVNAFFIQSIAPGIENVTHIIWPEGAMTGPVSENEFLLEAMGSALTDIDETPPIWLLNALRHERRERPNGDIIDDYYNSSLAMKYTPDGARLIDAYSDKRRLVPFGEFIPGGKWMEQQNIPVISTSLLSISAAKTKTNVDFPGLPHVSAQICYEIIFSGFTPHPKNEPRPEWILNQSNDAWYGHSFGPLQHANMAAYRAIEEGLPVVRAAANGMSGIIDPYGKYRVKINPRETGVVDATLPKPINETVFSSLINPLLGLLNLFLALCCAVLGRSQKT